MKVLIVEDDHSIALGLEYSLQAEGYQTKICENVAAANKIIKNDLHSIDLFLIDLSLPDGSGYDICRIVKEKSDIPVIFLTALDDEVNVVMGLDMGADDYVTKPFRIRELLSRINSVLRRYQKQHSSMSVTLNNVHINLHSGKVFKSGAEIDLTALEYRLLLTLINHRGQVLSRNQLLEQIWDVAGDFVNDNTLTVYIKRLREKLEDHPQKPKLIETVRGLGYRIGE